jgi:YbbR domain-containing protein
VFDTVAVRVEYANLPDSLVVVNPTNTVSVPLAGFRDEVQRYKQTAAGVIIDLSRATPGKDQTYAATPRLDLPGLTFPQGTIPISLTIEPRTTRQLDIEVRTKNTAAGIATIADRTYATCGNANDHCVVSVTGPASVVNGLRAYVDYDVPINAASTGSSPNQPIKFESNGHAIDLDHSPTLPHFLWTPAAVTVLVTTEGGSQSKTVPVLERLTGTQACGFQITSVDVQPTQVTVSGPVDAVSKVTGVGMDPVSIAGLTTGERVARPVLTGSSAVTADPQQVTVVVGVVQVISCAAPVPAPAATPTPRPT